MLEAQEAQIRAPDGRNDARRMGQPNGFQGVVSHIRSSSDW